jgi:tetratricopeptide (TPR) repeat protein
VVRSPHFTVLSDGGGGESRHVAGQLERMRAVFGQMFPGMPLDPVAPLEVVAVRNNKEFRTLEPAAYLGKGKTELAGYFQGAPDRNYILLRLDAQASEGAYSTIYHEYTHLLTSRLPEELPVWLGEGLAEFYETTVITDREAEIGRPSPELVNYLRLRQLMPLSRLLAVDDNSPYYHEQDKASIFYAEAWALTDMIMVGDEQHHTRRLPDYLEKLRGGMNAVDAAAGALGPLPALQKQLEEYIRGWAFTYFRVKLHEKVDEDGYTVTPATETAAEATEADVLAHVERYPDAAALAHTVLAADPGNARAAEALGLVALRQHDLAAAARWYGQAVGADAQDFLAQFSFGEISYQLHADNLDAATAAAAAHSLRQAIALRPDFAPAYDRLAVVYATRRENLSEAESLERSAVRLDPRQIVYRYNLAWVLIADANPAAAVTVLEAAQPLAATDAEVRDCQDRLATARRLTEQKAMADQALQEQRQRPPTAGAGAPPDGGEEVVYDAAPAAGTAAPPSGPKQQFEGVIQSVACGIDSASRFQLALELKTAAAVVHLQAPDYLKVAFLAANFTPAGVMNPCHDLTGLHAVIHAVGGQMIDITLRH